MNLWPPALGSLLVGGIIGALMVAGFRARALVPLVLGIVCLCGGVVVTPVNDHPEDQLVGAWAGLLAAGLIFGGVSANWRRSGADVAGGACLAVGLLCLLVSWSTIEWAKDAYARITGERLLILGDDLCAGSSVFPSELSGLGSNDLKDAWGSPFVYEVDADRRGAVLSSLGGDMKRSADDLSLRFPAACLE